MLEGFLHVFHIYKSSVLSVIGRFYLFNYFSPNCVIRKVKEKQRRIKDAREKVLFGEFKKMKMSK